MLRMTATRTTTTTHVHLPKYIIRCYHHDVSNVFIKASWPTAVELLRWAHAAPCSETPVCV